LVVGTVFPSRSHPGGPTGGLDLLRSLRGMVPGVPVVAIGGITAENAAEVVRAGDCGAAVISAIFSAPDPAAAAAHLRAVIHEARTAGAERGMARSVPPGSPRVGVERQT
jgi:thiamine-phosphate pyrophosphorylase